MTQDAQTTQGLSLMSHVPLRVVICGAGVIGAAIAYYLSQRGVAATVVERCEVACAASGKAGGFLALDWCDGSPLSALARTSFALHAQLPHTLGVDYGYRRLTTFAVAARAQGGRGPLRLTADDLAWLDCTALGLPTSAYEFFLQNAKVGFSAGETFEPAATQFVRLNFATSMTIVDEILGRMVKAVRAR